MNDSVEIQEAKHQLRELKTFFLTGYRIIKKAYAYGYVKNLEYPYQRWRELEDKIKFGVLDDVYLESDITDIDKHIDKESSSKPVVKKVRNAKEKDAFKELWIENYHNIVDFLNPQDRAYNEGVLRAWFDEIDAKQKKGSKKVSYTKDEIDAVSNIISEPAFLDYMLQEKKSLREAFTDDPRAKDLLEQNPDLESLVDSFSNVMSYTIEHHNTGNPVIGDQSKERADDFAKGMIKTLERVKKEGFTSTRAIAERLNELDVPTARGGKWSHNTVSQLNIRIKKLDLNNEGLEAPAMD